MPTSIVGFANPLTIPLEEQQRLSSKTEQLGQIFKTNDGKYFTLDELRQLMWERYETDFQPASLSSAIRKLRQPPWCMNILRREREPHLFEYGTDSQQPDVPVANSIIRVPRKPKNTEPQLLQLEQGNHRLPKTSTLRVHHTHWQFDTERRETLPIPSEVEIRHVREYTVRGTYLYLRDARGHDICYYPDVRRVFILKGK